MCNSCKQPDCYGDCFDDRGQRIEAMQRHQSYLTAKLGRAEVDRQKYKVLHANAKHQRDSLLTAVQSFLKDETEIDDLARAVYHIVRLEALATESTLTPVSMSEVARELGVNRDTVRKAIERDGLPTMKHKGVLRFDINAVREWIACNPNTSLGKRATGSGMKASEIADWIGVDVHTVHRWRARGMPASKDVGHNSKLTTKSEFIDWAKKYPHVWERVKKHV